jgi:anti-sigma regulatory factor (Ser/Thr protein kinase)/N-acetylglutamate synthase-like GNAT family acetyltransferase
MYETETEPILFSSLIKINYDKRFIRIAQDFVENLSVLAGANQKESSQIALLIEECLVFIIDKYVDCRMAAHIEICLKVMQDKMVRIEIVDMGPPIHETMIPSFDITNEHSAEGLWYKMARSLSDEFSFVNRFKAGWLIRIAKKLEALTFSATGSGDPDADSPSDQNSTLGEKHIRPASVADVPAIIDLVYMTYRYSYMFKDLYDADMLKTLIAENRYDIKVIEHGNKVIGAFAFKYSKGLARSAELGSAMISPAYRNASASALILRGVNDYVRTNPLNCQFFMSSAVTSHVRSQKMLARIHQGFKPWLLYLNMVPRPEFIGLTQGSGERESGLYVYHPNQKLNVSRIYATSPIHLPIIHELLANSGYPIEAVAEFAAPGNEEFKATVEQVESLQFATIAIDSLGSDWFTALSKKIFSAFVAGRVSIQVTIPSARPLPKDMERMLTDLNLVFCGLALQSLDRIDLAYCLSTTPVDFDQIKLHDPVAQKLLQHIQQGYMTRHQAADQNP